MGLILFTNIDPEIAMCEAGDHLLRKKISLWDINALNH